MVEIFTLQRINNYFHNTEESRLDFDKDTELVLYADYKKLEDEHRQILQDLKKEIINNSHYIANFKEIFKKYGVD